MIVGFVALILGANWLVNGATSVGIRAKLSPLIIGLTQCVFVRQRQSRVGHREHHRKQHDEHTAHFRRERTHLAY